VCKLKTEQRQLSLLIFIPVLLIINCIVLLLVCLAKGQLEAQLFFSYMFYAAFINIALGAMAYMGNIQSREADLGVSYNVFPRKTSDQRLLEQITNKSKALIFAIGFESVGAVMLVLSIIFS
jgi:hypothetical protein